jgi:hypothetical protein
VTCVLQPAAVRAANANCLLRFYVLRPTGQRIVATESEATLHPGRDGDGVASESQTVNDSRGAEANDSTGGLESVG